MQRRKAMFPSRREERNEAILHYGLYEGHSFSLAIHSGNGTLSFLMVQEDRPVVMVQELFTATELYILLPLLELYPNYAPYEVLYSSFHLNSVREDDVSQCRERLFEAQELGIWDDTMRPVRSAISRARLKLKPFAIDIVSVLATGYMLLVEQPVFQPEKRPSLVSPSSEIEVQSSSYTET